MKSDEIREEYYKARKKSDGLNAILQIMFDEGILDEAHAAPLKLAQALNYLNNSFADFFEAFKCDEPLDDPKELERVQKATEYITLVADGIQEYIKEYAK